MELWTAFVLGLVGSLHCAGMCGPLALALPLTGKTSLTYLTGRLAYNAGRIVTYCLIGMVSGLLGRTLALAGVQQWVSIGLGILLLLGLFASRRMPLWRPVTSIVEHLKFALASLLRQRSFTAMATLGLLNGLLPCGLVYVAAVNATSTGSIISGAQSMVLFGLGTVPMMLAISLSGKLLPFSLRLKLQKAIPVSVFVLAMLLILRGMSLGIPYISPDLSASAPSCCH